MKNCISKEKLFDFHLTELEQDEMDIIEAHLNVCDDCKSALNTIEDEVKLVKKSLHILNPEIPEIPEFNIKKKYTLDKYNKRKIFSWAASIVLLISISTVVSQKIIDNHKPANDYEYFQYIPDLNDAWKENTITVTCYDKKGNPIEHQTIKD